MSFHPILESPNAFLIFMLVPKVVEEFMAKRSCSYEAATEAMYNSKFYKALEDKKTDLWHLSPLALCEFLIEEIETEKITWTEEQS